VDVLRELGRTRPIASVRGGGSLGSSSLPAIKLFLAAEQFYRQGQYDSANAYAKRAVSIDSTFTLALRRIALTLWWGEGGRGDFGPALVAEGRHNHGLSPRESLLVTVDSMWGALGTDAQELRPLFQKLSRTLGEALQRFPEDPEIWYHRGEMAYHFGALVTPQVTAQQALDAFDRAIALDSAFGPPFQHSADLALRLQGPEAARRYLSAFIALHPGAEAGARLAYQLLDPDPARARAARVSLDTLPGSVLSFALEITKVWPDSGETAVLLARALATSRRVLTQHDSLTQRVALAQTLAYRGHLREASTTLTAENERLFLAVDPMIFAELALLNGGGLSSDTARSALSRCRPSNSWCPWSSLGLLAAAGDTVALRKLASRIDSTAKTPGEERDMWRYIAAATAPYLALARRDTALAIQRFAALPDSLCGDCYLDKLVRVRLLEARGENRQAGAVLDEVAHNHDFFVVPATDGMWALQGGRVYERLDQKQKAIAAYEFVTAVWRHADPELQPYVAEAKAALQRLGAETR
jgi:serine/threonine-protein kinase